MINCLSQKEVSAFNHLTVKLLRTGHLVQWEGKGETLDCTCLFMRPGINIHLGKLPLVEVKCALSY